MKSCNYNGESCWEATVVPGYAIGKVLLNGYSEMELPTPLVTEAGTLNNINLTVKDPDDDFRFDFASKTFYVHSADGLKTWAQAALGDSSINCILTSDITMPEDMKWTPIGTSERPYVGTFDGGNNTISGLTVDASDGDYVGLIGYLDEDGEIRNLTLNDVQIAGSQKVGAVAGENHGSITACSVTGGSVSGSDYVGVGAGENNGFISACISTGSVSGDSYVGGVTGANKTEGYMVACCRTTGSVTGNTTVGGVTGSNEGYVTACYSIGTISGSSAGAVAGGNTNGSITACYWSDYDGSGIGDSGTGEALIVDGMNLTWSKAMQNMNEAIDEWNYDHWNSECNYIWGTINPPYLQYNQ